MPKAKAWSAVLQAVLLGSGHVDGEFRALAEGEFRCDFRP